MPEKVKRHSKRCDAQAGVRAQPLAFDCREPPIDWHNSICDTCDDIMLLCYHKSLFAYLQYSKRRRVLNTILGTITARHKEQQSERAVLQPQTVLLLKAQHYAPKNHHALRVSFRHISLM
jgi:hypothetical protein